LSSFNSRVDEDEDHPDMSENEIDEPEVATEDPTTTVTTTTTTTSTTEESGLSSG